MSDRRDLAVRFERVAEQQGVRLTAYVARRVNADDLPDVVAQTLLTAWRRARTMPDHDEEALWWLLAIARRTVANHRRGIVRRHALADRLRALPIVAEPSNAASNSEGISAALRELSEEDQELVRLVYWDGLTTKAAAVVLNIGEATARKRLQRARERLRIAMGLNPSLITP